MTNPVGMPNAPNRIDSFMGMVAKTGFQADRESVNSAKVQARLGAFAPLPTGGADQISGRSWRSTPVSSAARLLIVPDELMGIGKVTW